MPDSDIKRTGPQGHLLVAPKAKEGISSPPVSGLCGCSHNNVHDNCSLKRPLPQNAHNSFTWTTTLEVLRDLPAQVLSQGVEVGNKQRLTEDESIQEIKLGPGMAAGCREEQMGLAVALY